MKTKEITYNPKGLKRIDNISPKTAIPQNDLFLKNNVVVTNKDHYWRIEKK